MRIRPIYNFKLLAPGYTAITLYPFIFFRASKKDVPLKTFKHELIHVEQVRRHGFFSFYTSYLLYYFAGLLRHKDNAKAYSEIPYESQAYDLQRLPLSDKERAIFDL